MNKLEFGAIVLLKFPFTNLGGAKKRPALVLYQSNNEDVVLCRISGQSKESGFDIEIQNWIHYGLKAPSIIRLDKLVTIENSLIDKVIGVLNAEDCIELKNTIKKIVNESV